MKKALHLFVLYFLFINFLWGQSKEGNVWVLGYPPDPDFPSDLFGGTLVNFNNGKPDTSRFTIQRSMFTSSSITDGNGNLLFYSNGCDILNRNHQIMLNGDDINSTGDAYYNLYCANGIKAYGEIQDMLTFSWPKHENLYKIIHIRYEPFETSSEIWNTTVDMELDGGMGEVVEKSVKIFDGGTSDGYMTATRHGNGEDWWITAPEWRTTRKFVFLLDSLGIHGPDIQEEAGILTGSGGYGQAAFSPDGTKYAEVCFFQGQVMDFDRCTGKFSNPRVIQINFPQVNDCAGAAFSPDSRYLYVSVCDSLFQYDLSKENFNSTRQTVACFDGIKDSMGLKDAYFYTMLLAPDDKIYMNTPGSTKALHIIHRPNEPGAACEFQKWGLELPTLHSSGQMPNLPNFRLGAMDPPCGSGACDTLPMTETFTLFPNPATDYVVVSNKKLETAAPLTFQLYDALGRLVIEERPGCLPHRVELSDLPEAGYFYRVFSAGGERLGRGTLLKVRSR